jgi:hypothetical protein
VRSSGDDAERYAIRPDHPTLVRNRTIGSTMLAVLILEGFNHTPI